MRIQKCRNLIALSIAAVVLGLAGIDSARADGGRWRGDRSSYSRSYLNYRGNGCGDYGRRFNGGYSSGHAPRYNSRSYCAPRNRHSNFGFSFSINRDRHGHGHRRHGW